MSTYTDRPSVEGYIEGFVTDDPFALERLIQRAEQDIDPLIVPVNTELPPTQVVSVLGATGGSLTLTFLSAIPELTAPISYPPSAAQVQSALEALPAIGVGSVRVVGTNPFTVVWDLSWARTNYGSTSLPALNWAVPLLEGDASSLTPTGASISVAQVRGRKVNPLVDLDANLAIALSRATCAQVEYRFEMGESFFVRPQYAAVVGPDFQTRGKLPRIAPKARAELTQSGLLFSSARAVSGRNRRGVARGWPTY